MEIDGMSFKPVGGELTFLKPSELPKKDYLVGQYVGIYEGQFGPSYKIAKKDGGTVAVNGCGALKRGLENVEEGTWVAIKYAGMKKLTKGKFKGKEFHAVDVAICTSDPTEDKKDDIPF